MLRVDPKLTEEELEAERAAEQEAIDTAEPLTEEEKAEKEELAAQGFNNWAKREFQSFIRGIETYGRDDYAGIQTEVPTKTVDEVRKYSEVFWERYQELDGASLSFWPPPICPCPMLTQTSARRDDRLGAPHVEDREGREDAHGAGPRLGARQAARRSVRPPLDAAQDCLRQPDQGQVVLGGRGPIPPRRDRQVRPQLGGAHQARHHGVPGFPL